MKLHRFLKLAAVAVLGFSFADCSRSHIEAINLANEGDQSVKVNVERAIALYEQAIQLDPTNHRILWKLATAYEKKEDWDKMASTLSRATNTAPDFANYWYKRGHALVMQAEAGNRDSYEQAKDPLKKCMEKDPNLAECYYLMGECLEWTDDEQAAAEHYTKAIQHDPTKGFFYPYLAELYLRFKLDKEAVSVAEEGARIVQADEKNIKALYNMQMLIGSAALMRGDKAGQLAAVEKAEKYAGEKHPEFAFNLGSTYATMDPPQKEKAVRLLNQFTKRVCRGAKGKLFQEQCETASSLLQKLGT
jgi:tetratricopeptide (TPR) repeat protein